MSQRELAKELGVSTQVIYGVVHYFTYRDVPDIKGVS